MAAMSYRVEVLSLVYGTEMFMKMANTAIF
jgi:hypothetical protein